MYADADSAVAAIVVECCDVVSAGFRKIHDLRHDFAVRMLRSGGEWEFTFAHPLVAEELLRIAQGNDQALAAVQKATCLNLLDLELHLLGRLISRPTAGDKECMRIIEDLVTTGLRVDPREAPRNYQARGQIVALLEKAPPARLCVGRDPIAR